MTGMDRRETEQLFHDRQAVERSISFKTGRANLVFSDEAFLDHESWIRPAFAQFGSIAGKTALDYGCGHGMAAVVLARAGAKVSAFDLSPGYVTEARERALANHVQAECLVANGEELPFRDSTFDIIWGNAILHHLDLARAGKELHRVLKHRGVAVFCEPWGGNPLLSFARNYLPYPGKERTPDEEPLTCRSLQPLQDVFPNLKIEGFQFLGMLQRLFRAPGLSRMLDHLDQRLLSSLPCLQKLVSFTR